MIEQCGAECAAVKPQLARFERLGAPGWEALERTVATAREAGLLVIADGKRGDVPHTAEIYGQALIGSTRIGETEIPGLGADALTVNPLLGEDSVEPLVETAAARGCGLFALVRTSNPGAADFLDFSDGVTPLHERIAAMIERLGDRLLGASGLSGMGAVVGATEPGYLARLRELMPRAIFLLPGIGAQGGDVGELKAAFAPGPAAALVTASRSIAMAPDPAGAAARLREQAFTLAGG